jgi:hypothetical protein
LSELREIDPGDPGGLSSDPKKRRAEGASSRRREEVAPFDELSITSRFWERKAVAECFEPKNRDPSTSPTHSNRARGPRKQSPLADGTGRSRPLPLLLALDLLLRHADRGRCRDYFRERTLPRVAGRPGFPCRPSFGVLAIPARPIGLYPSNWGLADPLGPPRGLRSAKRRDLTEERAGPPHGSDPRAPGRSAGQVRERGRRRDGDFRRGVPTGDPVRISGRTAGPREIAPSGGSPLQSRGVVRSKGSTRPDPAPSGKRPRSHPIPPAHSVRPHGPFSVRIPPRLGERHGP